MMIIMYNNRNLVDDIQKVMVKLCASQEYQLICPILNPTMQQNFSSPHTPFHKFTIELTSQPHTAQHLCP